MTELDIFMLQAQSTQGTGAYQIAMAFTIWVAFRVAVVTGEKHSENMLAKLAATVFGLGALFYLNMTYAFYSFNMAGTAHRLAELQASGTEISAMAANYVANLGGTTTPPSFSLVPADPIMIAFEASVLLLILVPIWGAKK
jgi:hypothetical protein